MDCWTRILLIMFIVGVIGYIFTNSHERANMQQEIVVLQEKYESCNIRLNRLEQKHNWIIEKEHLLKYGKEW